MDVCIIVINRGYTPLIYVLAVLIVYSCLISYSHSTRSTAPYPYNTVGAAVLSPTPPLCATRAFWTSACTSSAPIDEVYD